MFLLDVVIVGLAAVELSEKLLANSAEISCEAGYFKCSNDTTCVHQINICDHIDNCSDGSDEINCVDQHENEYYDIMFRKNPAAEHDDDSGNCVLAYNGTCNCRHRVISCQNRHLHKAPDDLPDMQINMLDFSGNQFTYLSPDTFRTTPGDILELVLKHCDVHEIKPGTFNNITGLVTLHLDNNFLEVFPADIFPEYNYVEVLNLRHNRISELQVGAFQNLSGLIELDLSNNKLSDIRGSFLEPLGNLTTLNLYGNSLRSLDSGCFPELPLEMLSLGGNLIEYLAAGTFSNLHSLRKLFLTNNKLRSIKNGTFDGLLQLQSLKLDNNLLNEIDLGVFFNTINLTSLDFQKNLFSKLDKRILKPLNSLKHIYFDKFEMCVDAPHVRVCEPKGDGISSQENLLDNLFFRTSVWVMAAVGCTGNLVVLLGRYFGGPTNNKVHSLYIKNLALSDLLMGVYLFTIAGVDYHYRGHYLKYQWEWRHSTLCILCGFLNTLSCESSVLILSLVTWDRFVSVTQPLARKQPSPKTAGLTLLLLWSIAAAIAAAPLCTFTEAYFGKEFYSSNGVCLPLYIHNPFANGWQYSVVMFMCVNALALLFICYAYSRMIREIRVSGVACRSTQQSHERDKVAQRFGIIVLTDCLCWVPVIAFKLAALAGIQFSDDYRKVIYASLAIYVLPINSALNPVLYTLTTTLFKKQMRKLLNTCLYKRRTEQQNSGYDSAFSMSLGMLPKTGSSRRVLTYRGTQSSMTTSKNSWRKSTAV